MTLLRHRRYAAKRRGPQTRPIVFPAPSADWGVVLCVALLTRIKSADVPIDALDALTVTHA